MSSDALREFLDLALQTLAFSPGSQSEISITSSGKSKRKLRFTTANINRLLAEERIEGFSIVERSEDSLRQTDFEKIVIFQQGCVNVSAVGANDILAVPGLKLLTVEGALLLNSSYSFMTMLPYGFLPPLWCGGIVSGHALQTLPAAEVERIGRWMNEGVLEKAFERGRLRGVYELNVLNACQAQAAIEGCPLWEWIDQHSLGSWSELKNNLYQWELEQNACLAVEHLLFKHGWIV